MVSTYILSIEDFTNRADITPNIQTAKLKSYLGVVQEKYALKILCQALYDELLTQIAASSLTAVNTLLLPYVKDYLIYKTYSRYLLNANTLSTPAGLRVQTDTTSEAASDPTITALVKQADGDANFFQDQLATFLKCNDTDYPLWKNSICGCGNKVTQKLNQFSSIGKNIYRDERIDWT